MLCPAYASRAAGLVQVPWGQGYFPPHFARYITLQHKLEGHSGCVNRLAWNHDGSLLASGSDDKRVRECTPRHGR